MTYLFVFQQRSVDVVVVLQGAMFRGYEIRMRYSGVLERGCTCRIDQEITNVICNLRKARTP